MEIYNYWTSLILFKFVNTMISHQNRNQYFIKFYYWYIKLLSYVKFQGEQKKVWDNYRKIPDIEFYCNGGFKDLSI